MPFQFHRRREGTMRDSNNICSKYIVTVWHGTAPDEVTYCRTKKEAQLEVARLRRGYNITITKNPNYV